MWLYSKSNLAGGQVLANNSAEILQNLHFHLPFPISPRRFFLNRTPSPGKLGEKIKLLKSILVMTTAA
jgi:hypothetical protein